MSDELKPCPFCGGGTTQFVENGRVWSGMKYTDPISVSVQHWCDPVPGQPSRGIERVGRDKASAIAMWNRRADDVADALIGTREELAAEVQRLRKARQPIDDGKLWSFLRSVMAQGIDIRADHDTYELFSARLDAAAAERVEQLRAITGDKP